MTPAVPSQESIRQLIVATPDPWQSNEKRSKEWKQADRKCLSHLFGEIYLGNVEKFAETLNMPCQSKKGPPLNTSNPNDFHLVITLCANWRMIFELPDLGKIKFKELKDDLAQRQVEWMQIGVSLPDDKNAWWDLVFNATFPDSDLMLLDFEIDDKNRTGEKKSGPSMLQQLELRAAKKKMVLDHPVDKWFEPTFKKLTDAYLNNVKTLVHCIGGRNRTPTFVVPWLIKTFGVSAEEALWFMRSKRYCSNTKCMKELKAYEVALATIQGRP